MYLHSFSLYDLDNSKRRSLQYLFELAKQKHSFGVICNGIHIVNAKKVFFLHVSWDCFKLWILKKHIDFISSPQSWEDLICLRTMYTWIDGNWGGGWRGGGCQKRINNIQGRSTSSGSVHIKGFHLLYTVFFINFSTVPFWTNKNKSMGSRTLAWNIVYGLLSYYFLLLGMK